MKGCWVKMVIIDQNRNIVVSSIQLTRTYHFYVSSSRTDLTTFFSGASYQFKEKLFAFINRDGRIKIQIDFKATFFSESRDVSWNLVHRTIPQIINTVGEIDEYYELLTNEIEHAILAFMLRSIEDTLRTVFWMDVYISDA